MSEILRTIEEYAKLNDIIFGVCDANDLTGLDESITDIPFFKGSYNDRISPRAFLDGAKSIIVLGVRTDMTPIFEGLDQVMAPSMSGVDYHIRLRAIANDLVSKLSEISDFNHRIQVDSGPLIERVFALKAGLGFRGKNGCIINPVFGSFFNIALIVTTFEIESVLQNMKLLCNSCDKCINSCPTKALAGSGLEYTKCISHLTQKRGSLTQNEKRSIGTTIYGCDLCQRVCPHNIQYNFNVHRENAKYTLNKILTMNRQEFNKAFEKSNLFWRGRTTIQRNCTIVAENLKSKCNRHI